MNDSKISVRYAKALFGLALEKNMLDQIKNDMLFIKQSWEQVLELKRFLESPVIKTSQKKRVIQEVIFDKINPITQSFLSLVLDNKRESYLAGITRVFIDFYKKEKGITTATLTLTSPLKDSVKKPILEAIKKTFTSNVELVENIKPEIMGGFVLRVEDLQYDASVATQLNNLKKDLLNTNIKS